VCPFFADPFRLSFFPTLPFGDRVRSVQGGCYSQPQPGISVSNLSTAALPGKRFDFFCVCHPCLKFSKFILHDGLLSCHSLVFCQPKVGFIFVPIDVLFFLFLGWGGGFLFFGGGPPTPFFFFLPTTPPRVSNVPAFSSFPITPLSYYLPSNRDLSKRFWGQAFFFNPLSTQQLGFAHRFHPKFGHFFLLRSFLPLVFSGFPQL